MSRPLIQLGATYFQMMVVDLLFQRTNDAFIFFASLEVDASIYAFLFGSIETQVIHWRIMMALLRKF
jgi:hypothetical protein